LVRVTLLAPYVTEGDDVKHGSGGTTAVSSRPTAASLRSR
jgi:hypothetical protein